MLKTLRRWLGWDASAGPFDLGDIDIPQRARTVPSRAPAAKVQPKVQRTRTSAQPPVKPKAAKPATLSERDLLDILDNPKLTLDRPATPEDGFDPYNTGAFNRSASWERISRSKR